MKYTNYLFIALFFISFTLTAQNKTQFFSQVGQTFMIPGKDYNAFTTGLYFETGLNHLYKTKFSDKTFINVGGNIGYLSFYDNLYGRIERTSVAGIKLGLTKAHQLAWLNLNAIGVWHLNFRTLYWGGRADLVFFKKPFNLNVDMFFCMQYLRSTNKFLGNSELTFNKNIDFIIFGVGFKNNFYHETNNSRKPPF